MKHYLQIRAIGQFPRVPITEEQCDSAHLARNTLSLDLLIEQKWDTLLQNYIELEKDLLSLAFDTVALNEFGYGPMSEVLALTNRRYINLLTAARMYVDQVPKLVETTLSAHGVDGAKRKVSAALSEQYDGCFEYRFMEALRNHVQHSGAPVHSATIGGGWTPEFNREWNEAHVHPYALRSSLEKDNSFKRSVLHEMPEKVNLVAAIRLYMERLGLVHKYVRKLVEVEAGSARDELEYLIGKYTEAYGKRPVGLFVHRVGDGNKIEHFSILLDWDDVRINMLSRNSTLINISKRTVTGRAAQ